MTIRKRTTCSGRTRFSVYVYDVAAHKPAYIGTFDRRRDAEQAEYEGKRRAKMGEALRPKPRREEIAFDALGNKWLEQRANIRRSTRIDYEQSLRRLKPYVGRKLVSEINRRDVDELVTALTKEFAPSTCRKAMVIFSMVMKTGIAWDYLDRLPTYGQRLALPRVKRPHFRALTPEEVNRLIDARPDYWKAAILLLFTAAPRRAELFGLRAADVNLEAGTITIRYQLQRGRLVEPKSESAVRRIVLPARTVAVLRVHIATVPPSDLGLLFPTEGGLPVDANNWYHRVWEPTRKKAGLPGLRVHDARHHLATILLSQGHSVKLAQRMLGHASASILLDVYASVTKQGEDDAASDLDRWLAQETQARYALNVVSDCARVVWATRCRPRAA